MRISDEDLRKLRRLDAKAKQASLDAQAASVVAQKAQLRVQGLMYELEESYKLRGKNTTLDLQTGEIIEGPPQEEGGEG